MRKNYGLLLAPTGEWKVIDTTYSPGIMDGVNHAGIGFTLLVAPQSVVDQYLGLNRDNILTDQDYIHARTHGATDGQKKRAIENHWGPNHRPRYTGTLYPSVIDHFTKEITEWEENPVYRQRQQVE